MKKLHSPLTLLSLALTLAACSGGGGGSSDSGSSDDSPVSGEPAPTVQVERISLTGVAIKGIARGAKVEFYPFDTVANDFASTPTATGTTDFAGRYQLDFSDEQVPSGVVKIVLSYQDGAELQCDNTATGDDSTACYTPGGSVQLGDYYPMPADFRLVSIADFDSSVVDANGARVINITALSSLASALFNEADPTLSYAGKVSWAVAQIRAILGLPATIDLTGDQPDNLVDPADDGDTLYGALNAAFERIAKDTEQSVAQVIQSFIAAVTTNGEVGQIQWKSSVTGNNTTLQVLINAADGLSTGADLSGIQSEIAAATDDTYTNKVPPVVTLGSNQTVTPGASVTLTTEAVQGITAGTTTYNWQTNAPAITFADNNSTTATSQTFSAPLTEGNYRFNVEVSDGTLSSSTAVTLTVKATAVVGSALDGDYHVMYTARRLEKTQNGLLMRGEMEDGGIMKIATGSTGSVVYEASDFSATNHLFENDLADTLSLNIYSEKSPYNGDGFQAPVAVQANGLASVNIPKSTELNTTDQYYSVDSAFTLRFIPVAKDKSLLVGFGVEDRQEFPLVNNQPDTSTVNFDSRDVMNVLLGRKNSLSGTSFIKNTSYNGFEIRFGTNGYDYVDTSVQDMRLNFDSAGALTSTEAYRVTLSGQTGAGFTLYSYSDNTPESDTYSFTNGRFVIDDVGQSDPQSIYAEGSHGSVLLANDKSALVVQTVDWSNDIETDPNNTAFDTTTGTSSRGITMGVYVHAPAQAIDLTGKTFSVAVQGFYAVSDSNASNGETAFGIRGEYGTATFATDTNQQSTMTITLTGKQVTAVPGSSLTLAKPATESTHTLVLPVSAGLTTGTDGCLTVVISGSDAGTYLCTDGTTLVGRHFQTDYEGTITRRYAGMMVGRNVTP